MNMNRKAVDAVAFAARVLIALLFVLAGWGKIGGFAGVAGYIASKGLPMPQVLAALTIALELGGGLALIAGFKTRWVAALFFLWLIPTSVLFHPYWASDAASMQNNFNHFYKNVSIMGAMAMLFAFGPGAWSVDKR